MILPEPGSSSRPFVAINMVSSVNGVAAANGKASGIGGPADRSAMRQIRSKVDAVMVGAGTLRAEKLSLGLDDHARAQPLAVIVCGEEPPPITANLIRPPSQRLLLIVPEIASKAYAGFSTGRTEILPTPDTDEPGRPDLAEAIRRLRSRFAVKRLLVEGGPGINGTLLDLGLVDELFVTIAPNLLATSGTGIVDLQNGARHALSLISSTTTDDEVFLRYRVETPPNPA